MFHSELFIPELTRNHRWYRMKRLLHLPVPALMTPRRLRAFETSPPKVDPLAAGCPDFSVVGGFFPHSHTIIMRYPYYRMIYRLYITRTNRVARARGWVAATYKSFCDRGLMNARHLAPGDGRRGELMALDLLAHRAEKGLTSD